MPISSIPVSSMPAQPISQAQFDRLENEWRQIRESSASSAKPPASIPRK
ncbi:MAG TPA: hypothetical protein VL202_06670 [Pararhizobium sp.]|nr:hypothetical protein [Pararhizobium sp.]HTO30842.1 hypothetical protein [Pararhizobium sp.]